MSYHAKFTPGPWSASRSSDNGVEWNIDAGAWAVAVCMDAPGDGEPHANAKLIAAAPELYAALRESIGIIHTFHGPQAWDIYYEHSPEMKRLRAALAKVES